VAVRNQELIRAFFEAASGALEDGMDPLELIPAVADFAVMIGGTVRGDWGIEQVIKRAQTMAGRWPQMLSPTLKLH
jgi:hypothetical protein